MYIDPGFGQPSAPLGQVMDSADTTVTSDASTPARPAASSTAASMTSGGTPSPLRILRARESPRTAGTVRA